MIQKLVLGIFFYSAFSIQAAFAAATEEIGDSEQPLPVLILEPAPQKVVVSIEPYRLLLSSFKRPEDQISVLLKNELSAHDFQMKPSHITLLKEADLFIWGGPKLEPFLEKAAKHAKRQIIISELDGIFLLSPKGHHHHGAQVDPHVWLSETNTLVIAKAIAKLMYYHELATSDIEQKLKTKALLKQALKKSAGESKGSQNSLVVYHDAFSYLEEDLGFSHSFSFSKHHETKPGIKTWSAFSSFLKNQSSNAKTTCFVVSPGFEESKIAKKIRELVKQYELTERFKWIEIDQLANDKVYDSYLSFLFQTQNKINQCMQSES